MARTGHRRLRYVAVAVLLLAPAAGLLWVPWYAGESPYLAGTPFFYWYQLAWVPGSGVCLLAAYALTGKEGRDP
ncbi:DUF3311 domain-containing protein [Streptomyces sp. SID12501]|uniref:DUF3311 domain-containing protein n=1 Tax=Streptomyces sp. SID12501 TaxID=2706042 RepID=A0A6B3BWW9_9ACTN|nr:DUF3311 domain-containing protein [Streptomyces sp. SID12501]NEC88901.1 DUF3311 domain-containing protein [Streptomyces sp. SID12501]